MALFISKIQLYKRNFVSILNLVPSLPPFMLKLHFTNV